MFENYSEKARRVIFFARYEASQFGADYIDNSHMLLALLREDKGLFKRLLGSAAPFENPAELMGLRNSGKKVTTSVDLPLAAEAKRVLAIASAEAEQLQHKFVEPGHMLLGIMIQPGAASELLKSSGLKLQGVRKMLAETEPIRREMVVPVSPSAQIVEQLREQFKKLTDGLKPEMEPAVVYRLDE